MEKFELKSNLSNKDTLKMISVAPTSEKDEILLWQKFISGDDQSLVYIYRKYVDELFRYGQQFSSRYDFVQDCIQELFIDIIDKRKSLSIAKSIKGYLFVSLKRKILRGVKKEERLSLQEDSFIFTYLDATIPINTQLKEEDCKLIYKTINELPPRQREVIFLYFYECFSYADIADIMEVKVETARTLTYRALENLENKLNPLMSSFYFLILLAR